MSYARSRLWLGIAGVGTFVLLAIALLLLDAPSRVFGGQPATVRVDLASLMLLVGSYAAVSFPFDWLGGYRLPCAHQRLCQPLPWFLLGWFRGVLAQSICLVLVGLAILSVGRWAGLPGVVALLAILMVGLVAKQEGVAQFVGGMPRGSDSLEPLHRALRRMSITRPRLSFLDSVDPGFVGGIVGLPGRERFVFPSFWLKLLGPEALSLQVLRRIGVVRTGARLRGLALAVGWNLVGFSIAASLPRAGVTTVPALLTTSLYFTLWSFVGLLLLPTLSRRGVLEADRFARSRGVSVDDLARIMAELDQLQDGEPSRPRLVETIFHPVPSVDSRIAHLNGPAKPVHGAWQAARLALFLSWTCLGLLSRAVHCNAGRPELWVMLPGD